MSITQVDPHLMNIELHRQNEELRAKLATAEQALEGCREALKSVNTDVASIGDYPAITRLIDSVLSSTKPTGWIRINGDLMSEIYAYLNKTYCTKSHPNGCACVLLAKIEQAARAAAQKEQT